MYLIGDIHSAKKVGGTYLQGSCLRAWLSHAISETWSFDKEWRHRKDGNDNGTALSW